MQGYQKFLLSTFGILTLASAIGIGYYLGSDQHRAKQESKQAVTMTVPRPAVITEAPKVYSIPERHTKPKHFEAEEINLSEYSQVSDYLRSLYPDKGLVYAAYIDMDNDENKDILCVTREPVPNHPSSDILSFHLVNPAYGRDITKFSYTVWRGWNDEAIRQFEFIDFDSDNIPDIIHKIKDRGRISKRYVKNMPFNLNNCGACLEADIDQDGLLEIYTYIDKNKELTIDEWSPGNGYFARAVLASMWPRPMWTTLREALFSSSSPLYNLSQDASVIHSAPENQKSSLIKQFSENYPADIIRLYFKILYAMNETPITDPRISDAVNRIKSISEDPAYSADELSQEIENILSRLPDNYKALVLLNMPDEIQTGDIDKFIAYQAAQAEFCKPAWFFAFSALVRGYEQVRAEEEAKKYERELVRQYGGNPDTDRIVRDAGGNVLHLERQEVPYTPDHTPLRVRTEERTYRGGTTTTETYALTPQAAEQQRREIERQKQEQDLFVRGVRKLEKIGEKIIPPPQEKKK